MLLGGDKSFKDVVGSCFVGFVFAVSVFGMGQGLVLLADLSIYILKFIERNGKKGCNLGVKFSDVGCDEVMFVGGWRVLELC